MRKNIYDIDFFEKGKECGFQGRTDFKEELDRLQKENPDYPVEMCLSNSFYTGLRYGLSLRRSELAIRKLKLDEDLKECA